MLKTSQKHINQNIHDQNHSCSETQSMGQNTPKIEKNGAQGGPCGGVEKIFSPRHTESPHKASCVIWRQTDDWNPPNLKVTDGRTDGHFSVLVSTEVEKMSFFAQISPKTPPKIQKKLKKSKIEKDYFFAFLWTSFVLIFREIGASGKKPCGFSCFSAIFHTNSYIFAVFCALTGHRNSTRQN